MTVLFSEERDSWEEMPEWASFLLKLGFSWPRGNADSRRIALVSMPCDSAAAGLITLGAMVRDLTIAESNDVDGHYEKLLKYAYQYLKSCKQCDIVCDPVLKNCGYIKRASGKLRSTQLRGTVEISDQTDFDKGEIKWIIRDGRRNHCIETPTSSYAKTYFLEDESPVQWNQPGCELSAKPYHSLFKNCKILTENLTNSFSGLCLAGRALGKDATQEVYSCIKIKSSVHENEEFSLDRLLTVQGWSNGGVSRVAFYNPRMDSLDRHIARPRLVVADGVTAFLKARNKDIFQNSDIIGVYERCIDREDLEALREAITTSQWYEADEDQLLALPTNPAGIAIRIIKKKG